MRINKGLTCVAPLANLLRRQDESVPNQNVTELFPDDENGTNSLEDQGFSDWPLPDDRLTKWNESGRLPEACFQVVAGEGNVAGTCDLAKMEVYDVKYDDCDQPWTICRCADADKDINQLVTDLGQLPVGARDYVRYVVMSDHMMVDGQSSLEGISLYTEGDLVIYGNWSSVGLFVHEVAHTLDWFVAGDGEESYSGRSRSLDILGEKKLADWRRLGGMARHCQQRHVCG